MTAPAMRPPAAPAYVPYAPDHDAPLPPGVGGALRIYATLARGWRRLVAVAVGTMLSAVLIALALPKMYLTGALVVPFSGAASRSSVALAGLPAGVAGLIGTASPAERVLGPVLGSHTLAVTVIRRVARGPAEERAVAEILGDGLRIIRNNDGSMFVQVRATDAALAARVANEYPGAINAVLSRVGTEGALTKQAFLRTQIDTAEAHLAASEQRYIEFAQRRTAPAPEQQASQTLAAAASAQQGVFEQEIVVEQLRRTATSDNPELRAAEALLASRRAQLRQLTTGAGAVPGASPFVPVQRGAELRVASSRVDREYQQDQRVYASLSAALLDAQIDASNSLPVFSILDAAPVPGRPTRDLPTTALLGLLGGLVLGVVVVLVGDVLARARRDTRQAPPLSAPGRAA